MRRRQLHTSMHHSNYYDIQVPENQPLVKPISPMNYSLQINPKNKEKFKDHMRYSSNMDSAKSSSHRIRHTLITKSIQRQKQKQKMEGKQQRRINLLIQKGQNVQRQKNIYNRVIDLQQIQQNPTFSARKSVLYPNMDFKKFIKHFSKKQQEHQDASIFFSQKINELKISQVVRKATHTSNMKIRTPFVQFNLKFLINKKKNLNLQNQSSRTTGSNLPYYQTLSTDFAGRQKAPNSQRATLNPPQNSGKKLRSVQLELKLQNIKKQVKYKD